ncbi:LETM1 domain-protein mdm28, mitochondrial [Lipomyces oligophaga]|uniref:LETM1 domain-protein mdm28, mitochondrial n=1 Tax=Lipomyces oligophaga TaxID=45792 RepID=UPI0034CDF4CB
MSSGIVACSRSSSVSARVVQSAAFPGSRFYSLSPSTYVRIHKLSSLSGYSSGSDLSLASRLACSAFSTASAARISQSAVRQADPVPHHQPESPKKPVATLTSVEVPVSPKATSTSVPADKQASTATADVPKPAGENSTGLSTAVAPPPSAPAASPAKVPLPARVWTSIKEGVRHTWDGFRLLGIELKISFKLLLKRVGGYELTRRENRQLKRTLEDLGRLGPFAFFVLVPFAELLIPVALRLFPNLLPSTFESVAAKEKKFKNLRSARKEVSTYLRSTLRESGLVLPRVDSSQDRQLFADFFQKIRSSGEPPSREDVIKVCRLFKDDVVLDNLSRPQLVAMARYLNLSSFGTDVFLRYQIRNRMRQIKRDDRAIDYEGVDSLSVPELQSACQSRGIKSHGVSPARLRIDLQYWLELRLRQRVPSTLLLLSAAYNYSFSETFETIYDSLLAVLSSIPDELYHEAELAVNHAEGAATNKQRLEVVKEQEELIKDENAQTVKSGTVVKDEVDLDEEAHHHHNQQATASGSVASSEPEAVKPTEEPTESLAPTEKPESLVEQSAAPEQDIKSSSPAAASTPASPSTSTEPKLDPITLSGESKKESRPSA